MSPTFRSLSHRDYRLFATGAFVSNIGTWMQRVAQDWLVLEVTGGSAAALGITTGLQFLPILLFSAYAGAIADRVPKRTLLMATQVGMAVPAAVLGLLAVTGVVETWHVYLLAFLFGTAWAVDAPGRQAIVSELVTAEDVPNAVGLNSASFNAGRIIGPAVAGLTIAAFGSGVFGTGVVILLNAASYLAVLAALGRIGRRPLPDSVTLGGPRGRVRDGRRLPAGPPRPAAGAGGDGLHRHLRAELPDDVRADGHRGLRQGRGGVRAARHHDGAGVDHRRPGLGAARDLQRASGRGGGAGLRRRGGGLRADAVLRLVRDHDPADRDHRDDHDHRGQHLRAADRPRPPAGPGDGAVPHGLHGRDADRGAGDRLAGRGVRRPLVADRGWRGHRGRRAAERGRPERVVRPGGSLQS